MSSTFVNLGSGGGSAAAAIGTLVSKGDWNAATNTPDLKNSTGTLGNLYRVSAQGSSNFGALSPDTNTVTVSPTFNPTVFNNSFHNWNINETVSGSITYSIPTPSSLAIIMPATADATNGDHIVLGTGDGKYYFLIIGIDGATPTITGDWVSGPDANNIWIYINCLTGNTAAQNATALKAALDADSSWTPISEMTDIIGVPGTPTHFNIGDHVLYDGTRWYKFSESSVPKAFARYGGSTTVVTSSLTTVQWTSKFFDNYSGMSAGEYTIPAGQSGKYQVNAHLPIDSTYSPSEFSSMELQVNGGAVTQQTGIAVSQTRIILNISDILDLTEGDVLRLQVVSNSLGSPSIANGGGATPRFSLCKLTD